jgi:hypothetical protein
MIVVIPALPVAELPKRATLPARGAAPMRSIPIFVGVSGAANIFPTAMSAAVFGTSRIVTVNNAGIGEQRRIALRLFLNAERMADR